MPSRTDVRKAGACSPVTSSAQTGGRRLVVRDRGRMQYDEALRLQRECLADVVGSRDATTGHAPTMYLLLVEHDPPVITVSRRPNARQHLVASERQLRAAG